MVQRAPTPRAKPVAKSRYFYTRPRRIMGPVSAETLQRLTESGQIRPDDLIAHDGTSKWRIACEVQGLRFEGCADEPASSAVLGYAQQPEAVSPTPAQRMTRPHAQPPAAAEIEVFGDPWGHDSIEIRTPRRRTDTSARDALFTVVFVAMGAVTAYGLAYTPPFKALMDTLRGATSRPTRIEGAVQRAQKQRETHHELEDPRNSVAVDE